MMITQILEYMLQILNQGSDKLNSCICTEQPAAAGRATLSVEK